jgi:hypothetical protein
VRDIVANTKKNIHVGVTERKRDRRTYREAGREWQNAIQRQEIGKGT